MTIAALLLNGSMIKAQEVEKYISQASSAYSSEQLELTRSAIQDALRELDIKVGNEVIASLPGEINNMSCKTGNDNVSGTSNGLIGLMVTREWSMDTLRLNFSIIGNSPMLAGINAMLSMPMMMGASNNQKKVTVEGYKGLLEKRVDDNNQTYGFNLQVPVNNSLFQLEYSGPGSENDFMGLVGQIPVKKIIDLVQ